MPYEYRFTQPFNDCVRAYENNRDAKAALTDTLSYLADDPFRHPRLQTHRVKRAQGKTFTSYVGNQGQRLIWRLVGDRTIVLLLFGEHDPVYKRAENLRIEIDDAAETLRVIDANPQTGGSEPYDVIREQVGRLFMAWSDQELAEFGFAAHEVQVLRRLDHEDDFLRLESQMKPDAYTLGLNLLTYGHPQGEEAAISARTEREQRDAKIPDPDVLASEEQELERQLSEPVAGALFARVEADALAKALSMPIEDWMVFLHPAQAKLAERSFSGPALITGSAGTGKTVVGLHRALQLARRYPDRRILFTTYVKNLPIVLRNLFERLEPTVVSRIDFVHLHSWAATYLRRSGHPYRVDLNVVDRCLTTAAQPETGFGDGLTDRILREEIDWVIKGRGIVGKTEYMELPESAQGSTLSLEDRERVWAAYERYQSGLSQAGVCDFNDLLRITLEALPETGLASPYASVIVDEAQDLTEIGARLVLALSGGGPDSLVILADDGQSIYPGGYELASVGIDVSGRRNHLTVNYRNTGEVLSAARRVLDGMSEMPNRAAQDADVTVLRQGRPAAYESFASQPSHDEALRAAILAAVDEPGTGPGDLAVLLPTHALVRTYLRLVGGMGYKTQPLEDYEGLSNSCIKVGTYQRGKGLEFKRVFLPRLEKDLLEAGISSPSGAAHREQMDLLRRQLYVAMTRARDGLWLGWVGTPSAVLNLPGH